MNLCFFNALCPKVRVSVALLSLCVVLSGCGSGGASTTSSTTTSSNQSQDSDSNTASTSTSESSDSSTSSTSSSSTATSSNAASSSAVNRDGRLLASQCFQCHGTNGHSLNGIDSLAGESASEIIEEMSEYQQKSANSDIMAAQAHGYSSAEIQLLADYLGTLNDTGSGSDSDDENESEDGESETEDDSDDENETEDDESESDDDSDTDTDDSNEADND